MLNSETKRHIDAARDVLVGVAPNPTTQIDQITYALIYKFMDDMDQSAIKAGGKPSFFTGDLEPYAWSRFMDSRMGNQEKMNLYGEALTKFSEAKQLPELFRTIFRAAFLPYRSPETLGLFLKEISYFDYSHPEELGNAYEYLLSIMSSQGDAGQFRTPRHIIDFIVDVINPTKDDKVLDPTCGTAGFLVSTYNHILEQHDGKGDPKKKEKTLTPDERKKLMQNLQGYDIDPTMVRIAQVNMYLHQFKNPQIFQYDSLTSEERWSEKFDVILANPPFMSPKGGIKPHNKFSVPSNRAEVLFVDYIINHLRPKGRAGIIVPEGIIFQSGNAYKALRKHLVENGLYAVVSLPGGVFQPYSGVKTSILLINNELAKQKDEIAFLKISADGYDLGSSKRAIAKNDLPVALEILQTYCEGKSSDNPIISYVTKGQMAESGDYNLSGDRYKVNSNIRNSGWPLVPLGEIADILNGFAFKSDLYTDRGTRVIRITNVQKGFVKDDEPKFYPESNNKEISKYLLKENDLLISLTGNVGRVALLPSSFLPAALNQRVACLRITNEMQILKKYLFHLLNLDNFEEECINASSGVAQLNLSTEWLKTFAIPLPPLEVQEQIVAELDGYAAIISGAKQIVENWKPLIDVDPEWPVVELGSCCQFINGDRSENYPTIRTQDISGIPFINAGNLAQGSISLEDADSITEQQFAKISGGKIEINDVLFCLRGSLGKMALNTNVSRGAIASSLIILRAIKQKIEPKFLYTLLASSIGQSQITGHQTGAAQPNLAAGNLKKFQVPLPPIKLQQELIRKIDAESNNLMSVKSLVESYEARTQAVIAKLWSE
jgi:type I restriction enzyme M protein